MPLGRRTLSGLTARLCVCVCIGSGGKGIGELHVSVSKARNRNAMDEHGRTCRKARTFQHTDRRALIGLPLFEVY